MENPKQRWNQALINCAVEAHIVSFSDEENLLFLFYMITGLTG